VDVVSRPIAERFAVHLVKLDPTIGAEMRKIRPCVVVSPEEMHRVLLTVIIAPMTGTGKAGEIALDQIRAVDSIRLGRRLGKLDDETIARLKDGLEKLFS
jgi:mRNA interferase MazF